MRPVTSSRADIHTIDLVYAGLDRTMASYLLPGEDGAFLLIETGPYALLDQLEEGIRRLGFDPAGLTDVLVTHIHLDHAGSAGALARRWGANVWVHEDGAPFLVDPERLISSARRVYGADFDALMKGAEPLPETNLMAIMDGDEFELHGRTFTVLHTPGHSGSHVSYLLDGKDLFTGDSAGIRFPETRFVKPATAPPEINLDLWLQSIARMEAAAPERLFLTHFGEFSDPAWHFRELRRQNALWARTVLEGMRNGADDDELVRLVTGLSERQMEEAGLSEKDRERCRISSDHVMTAAGLKRWWTKHHPERLAASAFPLERPARIAVLASGRGSNFAALAEAYPAGDPLGSVVLLVSDREDAGALELARGYGVAAEHVPYTGRQGFEAELELLLSERHVDLVCLAGFMRILSRSFTERWAGRLLNIHPSLLPAFRGLDPQQQALDAGAPVSGCSVHLVDAGIDTGPVIMQAEVPVLDGDDAARLSERILKEEHVLYPRAVRKVLKGEHP